MITCPKCKHEWEPVPTWRTYLNKKPGSKVHFFSEKDGAVQRTRLHYGHDVPLDTVRASMTLVASDHAHDPFFRWCDVPSGTIDEVIKYISRERILAKGSVISS